MPSVEELFCLVALFTSGSPLSAHRCSVDDFCQVFEHHWQSQLLSHDLQVRKRNRSLCLSEVMTILKAIAYYCANALLLRQLLTS
jgi:hypothetical protein